MFNLSIDEFSSSASLILLGRPKDREILLACLVCLSNALKSFEPEQTQMQIEQE